MYMISYIKGSIIAKDSDSIIVENQGLGYRVFVANSSSFSQEKEVELFCYPHIKREETMELYGVSSFAMLQLFVLLNDISGIGPKAALLIASLGTYEQLKEAIEKGNANFFQGVHGIGTKKVQKIILELTGKFQGLEKTSPKDLEATDALVSLGFPRKKAQEVLSRIPAEVSTTEDRVRQALKTIRR
jgi:holliday junction DNA helicase RuvA